MNVFGTRQVHVFASIIIVVIFVFIFVLSLLGTKSNNVGASNWFNPSWTARKLVIIDNNQVSGGASLTDFPVLINLVTDGELASSAQNDGDDIVFTSSDGVTQLSHEIESFNGVTGALTAWVKVPMLSTGIDTEIYLYYGNAAASNQEDINNVWDSNYQGVWHLDEDPSSVVPQILDSTSNSNNGTSQGSMTGGDQILGQINGSLDFDGSDDEILVPNSLSLSISDDLTLQAWMNTNGPGEAIGTIDNTLVDNFEYNTSNGTFPHVTKVSDTIYAIVYQGPGNDGFLSTVEIDSSGNITDPVIDTFEFETSNGRDPFITFVTGDIYAIGYRGVGDDGFLVTVEIDSLGNITNSVLDSIEHDTANGREHFIYTIDSNTIAIVYRGNQSDGFIDTFDISPAGLISAVDTLEYNTVRALDPWMINISGDVYAISYSGPGSDGFVTTVEIDTSGNITNTVIDSFEFDSVDGDTPRIINVTNDIYAIAYDDSGNDGRLITLDIDTSGIITNSIIDTFEYDTANGDFPNVIELSRGVFAIAYRGPGNDGFVSTVEIDTSGSITNTAIDSFEFDTITGVRPILFNVGVGVLGVVYQGPGSDGFVKTFNIRDGKGIIKLESYGLDQEAAVGIGTINNTDIEDADVSAGWDHIVLTYDNDALTNQLKYYINGVLEQQQTLTEDINVNTNALRIGYGFEGQIDEVRVSNAVRSPDWIITEYNNQQSPGTFYSVGMEETLVLDQLAYRFYENLDSANVGSPLAGQNTAASVLTPGDSFRLRLLLSNHGPTLTVSGESFKLQFAEKVGTCDIDFVGEIYQDVTSSSVIAYNDNPIPADGSVAATNINDPFVSNTVIAQEYVEANAFTNSNTAINNNQDGLWDFSLIDNGAPESTAYCLRVIRDSGVLLDSYTQIPEVITSGSLSVEIVDSGGVPVLSPQVNLIVQSVKILFQTSTGVFGVNEQRVRVDNRTGNAQWSMSIGANGGNTSLWNSGSKTYDFNDSAINATDGGDSDSFGGQLSIDPSSATITPEIGCSSTGIILGPLAAFNEGITDSITLVTAGVTAQTGCYWDFQNFDLEQTIPAGQEADTYNIEMEVTVVSL